MHLHTLTTVARETYPDWVLRSLQNLNIDSVAYNHAVSEQNWNKQASLWCVSVCASRGLGGARVLTRTKAYKTKMAARFLKPHDQPGVKNTPGVTRRRRFFPFALETWSSMLAVRWFNICNQLRWFDFDTSHIQEFHIKSLYIAKFEKNRRNKRNPSFALSVCSFSAKFPSDIIGQPSLALLLPHCNVALSIVSEFWILSFSLVTTRQRQQQLFSQNEPDWSNQASVFVLGKILFCFVLFFLIEVFIEVVESPNISGLNWRPDRECGKCQILLPRRPVRRKKSSVEK